MLPRIPNQRVFVAVQCLDFRKGIDAIATVCRQHFQLNPQDGHYFVFRNRRKTSIKILVYDSQGYWLCQKRLSRGHFQLWPQGHCVTEVQQAELQALVYENVRPPP